MHYGMEYEIPCAPRVTVMIDSMNIHLCWNPITQSMAGCPITVSQYKVYTSPSVGGTPELIATVVNDTTFVHTNALIPDAMRFYQVKAVVDNR
jgi:hypothetical protein